MRAVEYWERGGCKSKRRALLTAGYGKSIAAHPWKVFDSPAVLDELAKRGLNKYGMRGKMNWQQDEEAPIPSTPIPMPQIDFSNLPKEFLQDLKERLDEIPEPTVRYFPNR